MIHNGDAMLLLLLLLLLLVQLQLLVMSKNDVAATAA